MKLLSQIALISITSLLSLTIQAEEMEKKFNVGIGTYALSISYDNASSGADDELGGLGLSASYSFTDKFSIRGGYYSLEHDDFSSLDATGMDLTAYFGTGLASQGFKAYIGGGIFSETWDANGFEEDFSGLQLSGGIGYNWNVMALDFLIGIRDASDYEDFVNTAFDASTDASAVSGSLMLSAVF